MATTKMTKKSLQEESLQSLRKIARACGLKNYLTLKSDALITAILKKKDSAEETSSTKEVEKKASTKKKSELMETGDHDPDHDPSLSQTDEEEPEKTKASTKKETKKETKKAPKKRDITPRTETKSERVRVIVRELISSGRVFTSGTVMLMLEDRHGEKIHRSFASTLIAKEKAKVAEAK